VVAFGRLARRLRSAWHRHGAKKMALLLLHNGFYYARRLLHRHSGVSAADQEFDTRHGTDTSAIREIGSLDIGSENARYAVRYQTASAELFDATVRDLGIDYRTFTFLDFGSGKGKMLLLASHFPFARIIGVEFARELHEVAQTNIARYASDAQRCRDVRSVHADVTAFDIPSDPLVCYLYNPFGAEVIRSVAQRLVDSVAAVPRDVFVLYVEPAHQEVFTASGRWQVQEARHGIAVFRALRRASDAG
jgi:predicted RNA methylase